MGRVHPRDFLSTDEDGLGLPCSVLCLGHHPGKCVSLLPHRTTASDHLLCHVPCGPNPENKATCELRTNIWAQFDVLWASLVAQTGENLPAVQETWVQIPGSGRSPGEGNGNPLQYSCLEDPTDRGAWRSTVHGVPKSRTQLSKLTLSLLSS